MFRHLFPPLAVAVAIALTAGTALAEESAWPAGMDRAQHWVADHEALLNAKLGGLKAGLNLTPDQEKLWGPFENAVREAAKLHMRNMLSRHERMRDMMEGMQGDHANAPMPSPVDRLDALATRLAEDAGAIKNIADAAKPLYGSLSDQQKRVFGWLSRELLMMGRGHHWRHHRMGMMEGDREEMGMGPGRMEMIGPGHGAMGPMNDGAGEESHSDDE